MACSSGIRTPTNSPGTSPRRPARSRPPSRISRSSTERGESMSIALITGAAQGLGLGIAKELASRGAHVIIGDIQLTKAKAAAQELNGEAVELNIRDSASVTRCFEQIGQLDILVNNAGVGQNVAPVSELTDQEWQRVLGITL